MNGEPPGPRWWRVALGLCSGSDARKLCFDTVESVIVPGLEAHGIPAQRAWSRVVAAAASEAYAAN